MSSQTLFLLAAMVTSADINSAKWLEQQCSGRGSIHQQLETAGLEALGRQADQLLCMFYLSGMVDFIRVQEALPGQPLVCLPPEGFSNEALQRVFQRYSSMHPAQIQEWDRRTVALAALAQAFPCEQEETWLGELASVQAKQAKASAIRNPLERRLALRKVEEAQERLLAKFKRAQDEHRLLCESATGRKLLCDCLTEWSVTLVFEDYLDATMRPAAIKNSDERKIAKAYRVARDYCVRYDDGRLPVVEYATDKQARDRDRQSGTERSDYLEKRLRLLTRRAKDNSAQPRN